MLQYIQDFNINFDLKPSEDADMFVSIVVMSLSKFYTTQEKMKQIMLKHDNTAVASALQIYIDKNTNEEWNAVSEIYGTIATSRMKLIFPQRPRYLRSVAMWGFNIKSGQSLIMAHLARRYSLRKLLKSGEMLIG